jgi:hypothetical protein
MRNVPRASVALFVGIVSLVAARPACAKDVPLQYHGGPVLETFTIYPLYYGGWTDSEVDTWQDYLENLAAYMSGTNAPAFEQPMMRQYGVNHVKVAAAVRASPDAKAGKNALTRKQLLDIIEANQDNKNLPGFGSQTLIMVLPGDGFSVHGAACKTGGGCHSSESTSAFWAVIPKNQELVVVAHEVFEAAADPAVATFRAWDEAVDQCDSAPNIALSAFGGMQIPPATDNTAGGACSITGYTRLDEIQVYGWTYADYRAKYDELYPQGWRLYILQPYVLPGDEVRYNAVWRPLGNTPEEQFYGISEEELVAHANDLYPDGWRLSICQAYALSDGAVRYTVVWRRAANTGEHPFFEVTYSDVQNEYATLYSGPSPMRPGIVQAFVTSTGDVLYNTVWRPGDLKEKRQIGVTVTEFETEYSSIYGNDWRLYSLQSYVLADGNLRDDAIWRKGSHGEVQVYGWTYADYRAKYDELYPEGWRLYILNAYVLPGGEVRYNAVWRQGTVDWPL